MADDKKKKMSLDPTKNSFMNLIEFTATGKDVVMKEQPASLAQQAAEGGEDEEEEQDQPQQQHKKKDKKHKKKDNDSSNRISEEPSEEKGDKKKKKKEKKKKDKKKNKKSKEEGEGSELELDSDDDLSLGSIPMSSSSDDEDNEEEKDVVAELSTSVSKRVSAVDGLKTFQAKIGFQKPDPHASPTTTATNLNNKRRHTLGAALKGFQIDVTALQQQQQQDLDGSASDLVDGLTKTLPTLSVAGLRRSATNDASAHRGRASAFDTFLKDTSGSSARNLNNNNNKDNNNNNSAEGNS